MHAFGVSGRGRTSRKVAYTVYLYGLEQEAGPVGARPRRRHAAVTDAPRVRRAALPVELLVPARRVAPGRARSPGAGVGLCGARDHRRVLARGDRPRASRGEGSPPAARDRQRADARRRREDRAARHRSRELRQPVAVDHPRSAQRGEGQLRALSRRRRGVRRRSARAVAAFGSRVRDDFRREAVALSNRIAKSRRILCPTFHSPLGRGHLSRPRVAHCRAFRPRRRPCPARALRDARATGRTAARRRGRRPHARPRAARAAGHAHRDPREKTARRMRLRAASERRAAPALARAPLDDLPGGAARGDRRDRAALHVLAGRAALRIPGGDRAGRRDARLASAQAHRGRTRAKVSRRAGSPRGPRADRARARADRRIAVRALFPHRPRHRRVRALEGHPVPGPRLGGELGGLLRARHHRGRPNADEHAVRALHQPRAQRAAGHRRRFRAPAPRRGDAVRVREIRPRPRGDRRHAHHLPAEERGARHRQGARPRPRAGRPARRRVRVVGRPQRHGRAHPRGRIRAGQSGDRPAHRARRTS